MVVFVMVSDPSIKVSIKDSIQWPVFLLHNFVVFKAYVWLRDTSWGKVRRAWFEDFDLHDWSKA